MEGARWDSERGYIAESLPKELTVSMPVIWMKPIQADKISHVPGPPIVDKEGIYRCPVYKTSMRRGTLSTTVSGSFYI